MHEFEVFIGNGAEEEEDYVKAGIEGPYVLCPHSMSGIEALY